MVRERSDRAQLILQRLAAEGSLSVATLAKDLRVSEVTVRTHLQNLEDQGLLVRTRGGALPTSYVNVLQRESINVAQKERIAQRAASLVRDDDRIMIEAGTTTALVIRYLSQRKGVQIVTNSTLVFANARMHPGLNVILTGGVFRRENESLVGPIAERSVRDFNARLTFLGTDGFSYQRGMTTQFVEGAQVARAMWERSEQTWLLADSTKAGRAGFVSFLQLNELTGILTDDALPHEQRQLFDENEINYQAL